MLDGLHPLKESSGEEGVDGQAELISWIGSRGGTHGLGAHTGAIDADPPLPPLGLVSTLHGFPGW